MYASGPPPSAADTRPPRTPAWRKARLQLAKAVASVKRLVEQVVLDVSLAVRQMETLRQQIPPSAAAVTAQEDNLRAIQQRTDRKDPNFLDLELNTQEALAGARRRLLQEWVEHALSVVNLELAKGTLLAYDNIKLRPGP